MNNILPFIINHWPLLVTLVILLIILIIEETRTTIQGITKISTTKVVEFMNRENAVIIDVREHVRFNAGHIIGSTNIIISEIENSIEKLNKYKDKPIIMVCNIGQSSIKAGIILKKHNFTKVFSLAGGIAEWQKAGLPLIKS
jgi:rhodanese-related sulfurtransferase